VIRKHPIVLGVAVVIFGIGLWSHHGLFAVFLAAAASYLILLIGVVMLGGLARPVPEPPPPGELRRVRLTYRCSVCGTEVRMTAANDEDPEPPRHCQDDMDLVAPPME
jgi:hypothetical protein